MLLNEKEINNYYYYYYYYYFGNNAYNTLCEMTYWIKNEQSSFILFMQPLDYISIHQQLLASKVFNIKIRSFLKESSDAKFYLIKCQLIKGNRLCCNFFLNSVYFMTQESAFYQRLHWVLVVGITPLKTFLPFTVFLVISPEMH